MGPFSPQNMSTLFFNTILVYSYYQPDFKYWFWHVETLSLDWMRPISIARNVSCNKNLPLFPLTFVFLLLIARSRAITAPRGRRFQIFAISTNAYKCCSRDPRISVTFAIPSIRHAATWPKVISSLKVRVNEKTDGERPMNPFNIFLSNNDAPQRIDDFEEWNPRKANGLKDRFEFYRST